MPETEITRAETKERARLLHVDSYDVDFDFTRGPDFFGSVSVIRFDCREPGSTTHADLIAAGVRAITLNGVPLDPAAAWANGRITLPGLAARNELRVVADCAYTSSGTGMHRADSADGSVHIYAKLAQAYARTAYTCFDQPDLKAVFTFGVTAPAHWTVLSNQPLDHSERTRGDSQTLRFRPTRRLPTFTTTVVAGDYHVVTAAHMTPDGQQIPLELACRAALADRLDADALFQLTAQGLDHYTRWLGRDYPYAKYGQVFVPEFPHLASEDAGCVLISERLLFPSSEASPTLIESRAGTVLHEMAHMWFGDSATQEWWDDLWLSESFAEFCEAHAQVDLGLNPDAWSMMSVKMKIPAFADDQLPSAHPVASGASTVSEAIANFDGITYAKGAAVLRQLSAQVGEERFLAGLRAYIARYSYGNARLADFVEAVSEASASASASGEELAAWSKAWLETAGPNVLRCEFSTDAAGLFTEFAVAQEAPERHPVLRPHHVRIGLYERSGGSLTRVGGVEVDVAGARTAVPSLLGTARPDLILLNDDDTGYAIARFDPRSLETVLSSVSGLPHLPARAVCWNAVIDMVRQAEMPVSAFATMLAWAMPAEELPVLNALWKQAESLITRFATPQRAVEARSLLDAAAAAIPGLELDAEPRWMALQRLAAAGEADDARIDAELARDPSDTGRRYAAACLAAIPDAEHKEAAWRLLTSETTGPETVTAVAGGFMRPEHADLLAPYAARYLAEMPELWRTHGGHMRVRLANALFPYPAVTPEFLTQIDGFLAVSGADTALARIVRDHRDTAERALRARALESDLVTPARRAGSRRPAGRPLG
jgi:aminopeptidase N